MKNNEKMLLERLARRLKSTRGTAYFEFAVFVPLILLTFLFAADFTRVLYAEQQVEIASRVLCDIECHLRPGARDKSDKEKDVGSGCPGAPGKKVVRQYLAESLAKEGIFVRSGDAGNSVYCKGSYYTQDGPIHSVVNEILGLIKGTKGTDIKFIDILLQVFGEIVHLLTLETFNYLEQVFPSDKVVKTSVSVLIKPFSPCSPYTLFGRHDSEGVMLIPAAANRLDGTTAAIDRKMYTDRRVRYYCHMPSLETMPLAPYTYVRQLTKIFKRWIK